jgi:hypothetical protein
MTDRELMQQALEALEIESKGYNDKVVRNRGIITALRDRLAQPEQEPGAVYGVGIDVGEFIPPRREWVGLTEEEIAVICGECAASAHRADDISYARAIEAKLREKNA